MNDANQIYKNGPMKKKSSEFETSDQKYTNKIN